MIRSTWMIVACGVFVLVAGCKSGSGGVLDVDEVTNLLETHADIVTLSATEESAGGQGVVVISPQLQGRIMTMSLGPVSSTGYVPAKTIMEGEVHPHMNNFGGLDRFWIGPEAGSYGIYFPPGAEFTRDTWQVPSDFDTGPFPVTSQDATRVVMERDMEVQNFLRVIFNVRVRREVGIIEASSLSNEIGVALPDDVHYVGCYSANQMTNIGTTTWDSATGLIGIWILGMFNPGTNCVVIAPFDPTVSGPVFNDEYFGKVSEASPDRLQVVDDAVVFKADAASEGKFGLRQQRTRGIAGSFDFDSNLLTFVKFSVPDEPSYYGNSMWQKNQPEPYGGDAFQSYNSAAGADRFYELESASPVKPLAPGGSVVHRHATYQFHGSYASMRALAHKLLGVDLGSVKAAMSLVK